MTTGKTGKDINSHKRRQLFKLMVADMDMKQAQLGLRQLTPHIGGDDVALVFLLSTAAVVSYARPFSDNKGYGPLKHKYGRFDDPLDNVLHKNLIDGRNHFYAHCDPAELEVEIIGDRGNVTTSALTAAMVDRMGRMIEIILGRLRADYRELLDQLYPDRSENVPIQLKF